MGIEVRLQLTDSNPAAASDFTSTTAKVPGPISRCLLVGAGSYSSRGVVRVTKRFKVERESDENLVEEGRPPCEGAWPGAYLDESRHAHIGWFVTLDEPPAEVEGQPVRLLEASEEGVSGHIIIQDRARNRGSGDKGKRSASGEKNHLCL
jgi:hypothetical protein